ncbi:helix-turn-helix domain-containing protein [Variovorax ginsengisoli]|uniref:Helix-turn-helix transcriptional regulator n=1 Tax=Variovorax ginsengisoli TaxID=363844 RepID=A0ABT8S869_9BURK|nr:helix-turn-helix transcriptional regulator [Variovorax ginsengisoli]MDN8615252.1 helix-turn-helix transcriptional regulator [Variovorax ginsengisoli]MDO1534422.1 helix-turn-helix transcriptional regulator [Variovorax ginsengisoli]
MLASAVRRERTAQGFTQEDFARHIGMDRGYMGGVERGEHNLTFGKLMDVLEGLRTPPAVFFREIRLPDDTTEASRRSAGKPLALSRSPDASSAQILGEAVAHERRRAGFTQEEFAYHAGFERSYVSSVECGRRNPRFTQLIRILKGLAIEPADFFRHFRWPNPHASQPSAPREALRHGPRAKATKAIKAN